MAAKVQSSVNAYRGGVKKKRRGIHAKTRTSSLKTSKHYVKSYRGQGR